MAKGKGFPFAGLAAAAGYAWFMHSLSGPAFWASLAAPYAFATLVWRASIGARIDGPGLFPRLYAAFGWRPWAITKAAQDARTIFLVAAGMLMCAELYLLASAEISRQMVILDNPEFKR